MNAALPPGTLSPAQERILSLLLEGLSDGEIAARVGISEKGVARQVSAIKSLTDEDDKPGPRWLVKLAYHLGLAHGKT